MPGTSTVSESGGVALLLIAFLLALARRVAGEAIVLRVWKDG